MKKFSWLAAAGLCWLTPIATLEPPAHAQTLIQNPMTLAVPIAPAAPASTPSITTQPALLAQTSPTSGLELLTPGVEPRQVFRFTPSLGATQQMRLVIQADTRATMNDQALPTIALPEITMAVETTVTEVAADGGYTGQFVYQDVTVGESESLPPNFTQVLRDQLQIVAGLTGEFRFDAQGNLQDFDVELPETNDPLAQQLLEQISETFEQLSSPFPTAAIGLGAQWRVPQAISVSGIEFTQLTTYELVAQEGDRLTLAFASEQSGAGNLKDFPGMPEGFEPEIEALSSAGSGELTLDLNQLLPVAMQLEAVTDMTLSLDAPNRPEPLKFDVTVEMVMGLEG
ncbi:MAG: hypothetical protein ACPGVO_07295 [Spirulinaceae cyanobacterium]